MSKIEAGGFDPSGVGERIPLDPENVPDFSQEQQEIIRSGEPLEFGQGFLYHGRDGLDEILINGSVKGEVFLTRVAHQWAVGSFNDSANSPVILMITAEKFNSLQNEGSASLKMVKGDCCPKINKELLLNDVREIWIDEDTYKRYERPNKGPRSERERVRAETYCKLKEEGKVKVITGLWHSRLHHDSDSSFNAAMNAVGEYMLKRDLFKQIPKFCKRA